LRYRRLLEESSRLTAVTGLSPDTILDLVCRSLEARKPRPSRVAGTRFSGLHRHYCLLLLLRGHVLAAQRGSTDRQAAVGGAGLIDLRDPGMLQAAERFGLLLEAAQAPPRGAVLSARSRM
jgi:hypothetical protein